MSCLLEAYLCGGSDQSVSRQVDGGGGGGDVGGGRGCGG